MKKGLTEMLFILDRSGSMCGLETETIGGYNGLVGCLGNLVEDGAIRLTRLEVQWTVLGL